MKKQLSTIKQQGFTLIELLVVIGILGVLAAALIATIDPFEQLNKAQDTNTKNTLVEYLNANIRYYTTHSALPWDDTNNTNAAACVLDVALITGGGYNLSNLTSANDCIPALIADGELKSGFTQASNIFNKIYITGSSTNLTACFAPISKAQRNASEATWNQVGDASAVGCPNATASTCFWCSN